MPYDIYMLGESQITVSGGQQLDGVTQGDGSHLTGLTITLNSNAWTPISINDNDTNFSDSQGANQTLNGTQVIDGVTVAGGTPAEAEYALTLSDGTNTWTVVGFNVNTTTPAYGTVEGLAFIGGPGGFPPVGVPLTVVSAAEGPSFAAADYATPACFTQGTMILTARGERPVESIEVGDLVATVGNGVQPVRWVARRTWPAVGKYAPVVFEPGSIGNFRPLVVSQQHRMRISDWRAQMYCGTEAALVPARHFVNGDDIHIRETGFVTYHHLLFDRHEILWSEGIETESFFPGDQAVSGMAAEARAELLRIFPDIETHLETYGSMADTVVRRAEASVLAASFH